MNALFFKKYPHLALSLLLVSFASFAVDPPVAVYNFQGDLSADNGTAPDLIAIDPLSLNTFEMTTLFGQSRMVYKFDGNNAINSEHAGLYLDSSTLISTDEFSIEMVIEFQERENNWRNILDVSNRQSDSGLYIDPSNKLNVFPTGNGPNTWSNNAFHQIVLTNDGNSTITAYLDGVLQFDLNTTSLDLSQFAAQNPSRYLTLFVDNIVAGGQHEFSDGRIALLRFFDYELSPSDVAELNGNPLIIPPNASGIPALIPVFNEFSLLLLALLLILAVFRHPKSI